jgi:hypothetical protein
MNGPSPFTSITRVTPGHTDDGADRCELIAFLSVPDAFHARVNDRAEPVRPLIQHSRPNPPPPRRGQMFAKIAHNRPAAAAAALQFP